VSGLFWGIQPFVPPPPGLQPMFKENDRDQEAGNDRDYRKDNDNDQGMSA
jgi:hypothetical protein